MLRSYYTHRRRINAFLMNEGKSFGPIIRLRDATYFSLEIFLANFFFINWLYLIAQSEHSGLRPDTRSLVFFLIQFNEFVC